MIADADVFWSRKFKFITADQKNVFNFHIFELVINMIQLIKKQFSILNIKL